MSTNKNKPPTKYCKYGCKRPCAAGKTNKGTTFDTCCRSCAQSQGNKHGTRCNDLNKASIVANEIKSKFFCSYWHFLMIIVIALICRTSETILMIIMYFCILVGVWYASQYIKKRTFRFQVYNRDPLVWIVLAVYGYYLLQHEQAISGLMHRVTNLEFHVSDLEIGLNVLASQVKRIDETVNDLSQSVDTLYTQKMNTWGWLKTADDWAGFVNEKVFKILASKPLTRKEFGLGCFMEGSQIQIDKEGNVVNIEDLRDGDYIYNPVLDKQIQIKTWIYGDETGTMFEIMTKDSLFVTVTETHPMKICNVGHDDNHCNNFAAKDIKEGDLTITRNGYQEIISIQEISVKRVMVYNIMLDLPNDITNASRTIIADGIHSLDLYTQKYHG